MLNIKTHRNETRNKMCAYLSALFPVGKEYLRYPQCLLTFLTQEYLQDVPIKNVPYTV